MNTINEVFHGELLIAALRWWVSFRPEGWSTEEHLRIPTINTQTRYDYELAQAVARVLRRSTCDQQSTKNATP